MYRGSESEVTGEDLALAIKHHKIDEGEEGERLMALKSRSNSRIRSPAQPPALKKSML